MNYKGEVPEIRGFSKFEFPAHASGADETLVSFGLRSNRRRDNVAAVKKRQRQNTGILHYVLDDDIKQTKTKGSF